MNKLLVLFFSLFLFSPALAEKRAGNENLSADERTAEQRIPSNVQVVKLENGAWQLLVDGKPFIIKGMEYSVDVVGKSGRDSNQWILDDYNNNTLSDGPFDSWVDTDGDNFQGSNEHRVGDFQLLKEMGCNTIRVYHPTNISKDILRTLYEKYGIRVIMGNFLGAYTIDSGADWSCGTDYRDPLQRERMKESVRKMVAEYKDEPFVLMWMLGNENDAVGSYDNSTLNNTNACVKPKVFARFVNEISEMIKKLDPNHPVGICNATYKLLRSYSKYAPSIDIIGMNAYTGPYGFGTLWSRSQLDFDRPVLITEYGCDVYNQAAEQVDEDYQALYHRKAWLDIEDNSYLGNKVGNSLGGVIYCWLDKWWLCGSPKEHDVELGSRKGPKADGYFHDEWMGICGQGKGLHSPFQRQLRKVYFLYKDELWNKDTRNGRENQ